MEGKEIVLSCLFSLCKSPCMKTRSSSLLSVLHLALRAPVACRVAKKRNSPRKRRKRLQVHSPKHHAAGQVWGKLFTFLRRKEILRNKLVTSPKMAQFCCTFSRTCGKTTVLALLVLPGVKAKGSFFVMRTLVQGFAVENFANQCSEKMEMCHAKQLSQPSSSDC